MWSGLMQKHARYRETNVAIAFEQQGFFEQALGAYEAAETKAQSEFSSKASPSYNFEEYRLWAEHWAR